MCDVVGVHLLPHHDLLFAFVVESFLADFEDIHSLFVELSLLLLKHNLMLLRAFKLINNLLRLNELGVQVIVEVLPFAFLFLDKAQRFIELGLFFVIYFVGFLLALF